MAIQDGDITVIQKKELGIASELCSKGNRRKSTNS